MAVQGVTKESTQGVTSQVTSGIYANKVISDTVVERPLTAAPCSGDYEVVLADV